MKILIPIVIAFSLASSPWLTRWFRDTNSTAAVRRGVNEFEAKKFGESVEAFGRAARIRDDAAVRYDLGTAEIAAGQNERGARLLEDAIKDPTLRPSALFNRGNASLQTNHLDEAIADYSEALRSSPGDLDAKRNLEIALRKKEQQKQEEQKKQQNGGDQPKPQPEEQPGDPSTKQQQANDVESLLRSIEQQEREELSRMNRARPAPRRIGW